MVDAKVPPHQPQPFGGRRPKASTPPPNVIPFAKPRAIAQNASQIDFRGEEATRISPPPAMPSNRQPAPQPQKPWTPQMPPAQNPWVSESAPTTQANTWSPPKSTPLPTAAPQAPAQKPAGSSPAVATTQAAAPLAPNLPAPPPMGAAPNLPPMPAAAAPVMLPASPKHDPHKWAIYDKLGLGAPKLKIDSKKLGKWIVSAYRMLGFVILTIIVLVLVGYIVTTAFYYVSNSWVVPMAVSSSDEKVVALQAQVAEQQNQRDRIADELNQADRLIASQQSFQAEFQKAIKNDLDGRTKALGKIRALASAAAETRASIRAQSAAYAAASNRRMAEEYKAGLIDRNSMLSGKFQVAQISSSNLSLAERQAEYETRAAEIEANAKSLDALLDANGANGGEMSYEVLRIKQELEASRLELAKAVENRNTLKSSLDRQDKLIASLSKSAYLRAVNDKATVTFVPYSNLGKVKKGDGLYACKVGMVICHHVGDVLEVLPGEVQFKHPHKDKQLRGQMVEVKLDAEDSDAAEDDVLFVGGAPLLF